MDLVDLDVVQVALVVLGAPVALVVSGALTALVALVVAVAAVEEDTVAVAEAAAEVSNSNLNTK